VTVSFSQQQLDLLQQSYDAIKASVYQSLLLQTRFKPLFDQVNLVVDSNNIRLDFSQLVTTFNQEISTDLTSGVIDLVEFNVAVKSMLADTGWSGWELLSNVLTTNTLNQQIFNVLRQNNISLVGFDGFTASGDGLSELVFGGQLNDTISGGYKNDQLFGGSGNDLLLGQFGDDTLLGGDGNDELIGGIGSDILKGGAGDDRLGAFSTNTSDGYVDQSANVLEGGTGNDTMYGSVGSDTYIFNIGDGADTIYETQNSTANTDVIQLGAGILPSEVTVTNSGYDLLLKIGTNGDQITIKSWYQGDSARIEQLKFADGTIWDKAAIHNAGLVKNGTGGDDLLEGVPGTQNNIIYGFAGNDTLNGFDGNDSLYGGDGGDRLSGGNGNDLLEGGNGNDTLIGSNGVDILRGGAGDDVLAANIDNMAWSYYESDENTLEGGTGNDTLFGGAGSDTYIFNIGDGADTIFETQYGTRANTDVIQLGAGISPSLVTVTTSNYDLVLIIGTNGDQITIKDWYQSESYRIEQLKFADGLSVNLKGLILGTANADTLNGTSSADYIQGDAGADVITAGDGNDMIDGGANADNMAGGKGDDAYVVDNPSDVVSELSGEGVDLVYTSITYSLVDTDGAGTNGGNVENLTLTGVSAINGTGNALTNVITGNAAANVLNGGAGIDTLVGGDGNDTYIVDTTTDTIIESTTGGIDTVQSSVTFTLGDSSNLENLVLSGSAVINGTGNDLNNGLIGNSANNILTAGAGNDTLNGGAGIDTLIGGDGNDTYIVDTTTDVITETSNGGVDTVQSSVTFTLGTNSNLENLTLTGAATINGSGNALDNVMTGNSANNKLTGGAGNDTLNGGAGVDTLIGGDGDDIYIIDSTTDTITEFSTGGVDTVMSNVVYTLGVYLENLTITGTANLSGFGNSLNNIITGNSGVNTLNGWGGIDTLIGGAGDDVYIVDTATDVIIENANEGIDTVRSDVSYVLGANLEKLVLTGSNATNGTGNALSNVLTGNAVANILDGGTGIDILIGGDGDDTYIVDTTTDTITETATGGNDTVQSSVTYTLGASSNLENLSLTGSNAINGTGNALSNFLLGNSANNTLTDTLGGNDVLQGLSGNDILNDTSGNNLLDGGIGTDTITAGSGSDLVIGGASSDTITTGTGYDVILFNKGDGVDTIKASVGTDNTLSLGGNFAYSDLSLTKSSNDLILKMGTSDQITLKGWYDTSANNKSVLNLQVIAEAMQGFSLGGSDSLRNNKVETFNFANLVSAFDAAGATANWQLTDARLTAHLSAGSDTAAIGGDIAYQYGKAGSLTGVGLLAAQAVMNNASVGQSAQTLNETSSWATETIKLS